LLVTPISMCVAKDLVQMFYLTLSGQLLALTN
jgi:hypothetical protein